MRRIRSNKNKWKTKKLNRVILGTKDRTIVVDHADRDILNNRRKNLRETTKQMNEYNEKPIRKNNTSGYKGVTYDKFNKKWMAQIMYNGKSIKLGRFKNKKDAVIARLNAEVKYCGCDFASRRHLFDEFNIKY